METIKQVLMREDGMTSQGADYLIAAARKDMLERLTNGEMPHEWFGLEPDYLDELIPL
jgi:hypothetical protein